MSDSKPKTSKAPSVKEIRHKMEVPMLIVSFLLTLTFVALALILKTNLGKDMGNLALAALFSPIMAFFYIRFGYWKEISNAVEINEDQMPDIYNHYSDVAKKMGMKEIPRLYLSNGNGSMNAYAAKCTVRRKYVVIYSDIVDLAYEMNDMSAVRFVLAHELGHIYCGHVSLWRMFISTIPSILMIGGNLSRAQEYSADRCGSYFVPEGAESILALFAGKRTYKKVNMDAYLKSVKNHKPGFWFFIANFLSSHPVGFRRVEALSKVKKQGWDINGKLF